ncbi:MAG: DUF1995 family protein [Cyanobacteria bacterium P01_D01_bin.105]
MSQIPQSIAEATEQAKVATQTALNDGYTRLQIEMVIPELKQQPIAQQFLEVFSQQQFKVFFPDAGAAALARRDWQNPDFVIRGIGELSEPVEADDDIYLVVNPSSIEVETVESLCTQAIDRPVVILNPTLEDVAVVGIGYAARQLRERFLSQIESCYYIRPLDSAALYRCYPSPWQIWRETAPDEYELLCDLPGKPSGEEIDRILYGDSATADDAEQAAGASHEGEGPQKNTKAKAKKGLFSELQQFIKALTQ